MWATAWIVMSSPVAWKGMALVCRAAGGVPKAVARQPNGGVKGLSRPVIAYDRDVEAAPCQLGLHPAELVGIVVGTKAHAIPHALVRPRSLLHRRLPPRAR